MSVKHLCAALLAPLLMAGCERGSEPAPGKSAPAASAKGASGAALERLKAQAKASGAAARGRSHPEPARGLAPILAPEAPAPGAVVKPAPLKCWRESWPNTYGCPSGQPGSISSVTKMLCPSGPYGTPEFREELTANSCAAAPPAARACAWSDWTSYCEIRPLTRSAPGEPGYEEYGEWGWKAKSSCGEEAVLPMGSQTTRGGGEYSSVPNRSESCWAPQGKPPHCETSECS